MVDKPLVSAYINNMKTKGNAQMLMTGEIYMIKIEEMCDGWRVQVNDKSFMWDHNDDDMGTKALKELLEHLGYTVEIEECY